SIAGMVTIPPPPAIASMKPASSAATNSHASRCRARSCIGNHRWDARGAARRILRTADARRRDRADPGRIVQHPTGDNAMRQPRLPSTALLSIVLGSAFAACLALPAAAADGHRAEVTEAADALRGQVVEWRRDIHQHPELGNREVRTAALVADHLRALGLEPKTGIATTGVTAVLRGGRPGPRIALRADMDALPVTEATG